MQRILQAFAVLIAAATAFATLGPPSLRPHLSVLGQNGEHALAFAVVGFTVGLALSRNPWLTALLSVTMTGLVELAQLLAPGRHARWSDFVVDALTLCAGLVAAACALRLTRLRFPARVPTKPDLAASQQSK